MKRYLILSVITMMVSVTVLQVTKFSHADAGGPCTGTISPSGATLNVPTGTVVHVIVTLSNCPTDVQLTTLRVANAPENVPDDGTLCYKFDATRPCPALTAGPAGSSGKFDFPWTLANPTPGDNNVTITASATGSVGASIPTSIGNSITVTGQTGGAQAADATVTPSPCPIPTLSASSGGQNLGAQPSVVAGTKINVKTSVSVTKVSSASFDPYQYQTIIVNHTNLFDHIYQSGASVPASSNSSAWDTTGVAAGTYTFRAFSTCWANDNFDQYSSYIKLPVTVTAAPGSPTPPSGGATGGANNAVADNPPQEVVKTSSGQQVLVTTSLLSNPTYKALVMTPYVAQLKVNEANPLLSKKGVTAIDFKGKASPDTKYQLVVFSEPKKLDFTADKDGNWQVQLDGSLPAGHHEAYVVLNDKAGKPVQRSSVLSFLVPTAQAASAAAVASITPTQNSIWKLYALYSGLTVLASIITFAAYEAIKRRLAKQADTSDVNSPPPTTIPPSPTPPEV